GFNQPRGLFNGSVLGAGGADYEVLSSSQYQAWYPEHGGNLDIAVGGDVVGDQWAEKLTSSDPIRPLPPSAAVGNWLWRQGSADREGVPTAWWVNFGSYVRGAEGDAPYL
ncbi:hypothetical protein L2E47_51640, partial [Pseudomonas aeruginosa]|nr:hypothetical protein [Pseudomonas aeruginosa]